MKIEKIEIFREIVKFFYRTLPPSAVRINYRKQVFYFHGVVPGYYSIFFPAVFSIRQAIQSASFF